MKDKDIAEKKYILKNTLLDNFFQMKPPRHRLDNLANWFPYGATGHITYWTS